MSSEDKCVELIGVMRELIEAIRTQQAIDAASPPSPPVSDDQTGSARLSYAATLARHNETMAQLTADKMAAQHQQQQDRWSLQFKQLSQTLFRPE